MNQLCLFDDELVVNRSTTAIYPNRRQDKWRVEKTLHLAEQGNDRTEFFTSRGTRFAVGYVRVVYGDHGPYVEFLREQICAELNARFNCTAPADAYYEWLEPKDGSGVKVYDQKRDVKQIKNAPAGGFAGNRAEGYADYIPGMIYVSPFELAVQQPS